MRRSRSSSACCSNVSSPSSLRMVLSCSRKKSRRCTAVKWAATSRMVLWSRSVAASLTSGNTPHAITNPGASCRASPNARMTARPRGVRLAPSPVLRFFPLLGCCATRHLVSRPKQYGRTNRCQSRRLIDYLRVADAPIAGVAPLRLQSRHAKSSTRTMGQALQVTLPHDRAAKGLMLRLE